MKFKSIPALLAVLLLLLVGLVLYLVFLGSDQEPSASYHNEARTPEEQLDGFKLADGFVIELVASERDGVIKPIDLTFDDAGRLWTQTARMYPMDPIADIQWNDLLELMNDADAQKNRPEFKRILELYQGKTKGEDKILILSNIYGKGPAKVEVWADGLTIPQSILPYKDGALVAQGSELFLLQDTDNDGKADKRTPLFTGFGFTDSHTMAHTLIRAPGGWVHLSHGGLNKGEVSAVNTDFKISIDYAKIARFTPSGTKMEIVNSGLNNIWGYQLRHNGQWFASEANDFGYSVVPMESGTGFPGIGSARIRSYQPWMPPLHEFRVGGTGLSGLAFADDAAGSFPEEWKNVAFLANPITSTINAVRITRNPDGSISSEHLQDLLVSEDKWFRPVNMEFGPDGCLYIADWYNKIISHNEVPTTHPERDKSRGRIWRIRHISQKPRQIPDFYSIKTADLPPYLASASLWEKRAAWQQLSDRPASETKSLARELIGMASDPNLDDASRIHALWSLEGIAHYDETLINSLIVGSSDDLRREAIRSMASFGLSSFDVAAKLKDLIGHPNPMIRSQVIRTLAEVGDPVPETIEILLNACTPELPGNKMGGSYERRFERFLARMALEQFPDALKAYLESPAASSIPAENKIWASQALGKDDRERYFLKLWPLANLTKLDEPNFIIASQMLENRSIYGLVKSYFEKPDQAADYVRFAVQNQSLVQSDLLAGLLQKPIGQLLKEDSKENLELGLDAIGKYQIKYSGLALMRLLDKDVPESTLNLLLKALAVDPAANQRFFGQIFQEEAFSFGNRALALHQYSKTNTTGGAAELTKWIPSLDGFERSQVVKVFAGSKQGADILKQSYKAGLLEISSFTKSTAEQVNGYDASDPIGSQILTTIYEADAAEKKMVSEKISRYQALIAKVKGNASSGKTLFQNCLGCHRVGNEGQDFAPALDGSASRDTEALLTALLDPDAAVESNYAIFRVTKKDGQNIEGYLVNRGESGTTIGMMGGAKVFVQEQDIKSQGFLGGRSFMMRGLLDNLSDQEVADLFAYIRTLE